MFKLKPIVYAVGNEYQIMVRTDCRCTMWVKVGDKCYYDHVNGILRSETKVHKMIVPMEVLDCAKGYTICGRKIIDRKPYYTETEEVEEYYFEFRPVNGKNFRTYNLADVHNCNEMAIAAVKAYGEIDFLIMNGDIPNHGNKEEYFDSIYELSSELTGGEIPVVFSRGNHDMRGVYAEKFIDYTPTENGNSYYTFRLGSIWGIVLDCGEDKVDEHVEYGNTICCHSFRESETEFLHGVADAGEYNENGIEHKLVISHTPFFFKPKKEIFVIDDELYAEWCRILKEKIKPEFMICGHMHELHICEEGGEIDDRGIPCPAVVGPDMMFNEYYVGTGISVNEKELEVSYTNHEGKILEKKNLILK